MRTRQVIECRTCTLDAVLNGGATTASEALYILPDGDAATHHKIENPGHAIVIYDTLWGD